MVTPRGGRNVKGLYTHRPFRSSSNVPMSLVSPVNLRPGTYRDNDTDNDASHCDSEMHDAVPSASRLPRLIGRSFVLCSADSRTREIVRCQRGHCDIVSWVGSDPKGAGCIKHLARFFLRDSCPTYSGRTLGLMSAERIIQGLGLSCSEWGSFVKWTHDEAV